MSDTVLSQADYELAIRGGLRARGIADEVIDTLLAARWPLFLPDLLAECGGRGRLLTVEGVGDWLRARFGEPIDPNELAYRPRHVEELLQWACENGVGQPTFAGWAATMRPNTLEAILRKEKAPQN